MDTLKKYSDDPQTSAAAIAAIYRLSRKATELLKKLSFDEQMLTLAALQHVDANKLDLSALPVNVETASPDLLRLALVVVGLDRAPTNMLHPRHTNAQLVKALGGHDDNIVSQYTVWAITENKLLGLGDLGIDIRDVEQQPPNVRAWMFRLVAMSSEDAERNFEYIELGTQDPSAEARIGLAIGLKGCFFDGLETLVLDWFTSEDDAEVRQHLLDHMIEQCSNCANYEELVLDVYEKEAAGSSLRQRMHAASVGSALYAKFKRFDADGSADLFRGTTTVNNTYNIFGGIQGGAVSLGGDATNTGQTGVHYNPQTIEAIQGELSKAELQLYKIEEIDSELKSEALKQIEGAKGDPTPDKLTRVISVLGKIETVATKTAGTGTALKTIGTELAKLAGFL